MHLKLAAALVGVIVLTVARPLLAQTPLVKATAMQTRTKAKDGVGPFPLWDTVWWIDVDAQASGAAQLDRIDYRARFVDGGDRRGPTGGWDVGAERVTGRLSVSCATRPDYDRHLRVELRARDNHGETSNWITVEFPPSDDARKPSLGISVSTAPRVATPQRLIATVEVEASDHMTIGDVRTALQSKAVSQGASAAVGLRLVRSDSEHVVFAADLVRDVVATPTPPRASAASSENLLGEIVIPTGRQ